MLTHTGTVTASAGLYVRSAPNGAIITKLAYATAIQGQGELVLVGTYHWMHIVSPVDGYVAGEFLNYTSENVADEETPSQEILVRLAPNGTEYRYRLVEA